MLPTTLPGALLGLTPSLPHSFRRAMRMEMLFSTSASAPWPIVLVSDLSCLILCFCPWHLTGWDLESGMEVSDEPLLSSVRDVMDELPQKCKCCTEVHGCHLADVGPPFVFKLFYMWSAHLLGCDFLKCKSFWMCGLHVCDATCMHERAPGPVHPQRWWPWRSFNILLLPWTLNGVAHGCEVLFLVADLFFFFFGRFVLHFWQTSVAL